jgi:uncharacterized protein YuzE
VNKKINQKMKITYDSGADALYIAVRTTAIVKTKEEGVCLVDYDAEGNIVGIEVLHYSKRVSALEPATALRSF